MNRIQIGHMLPKPTALDKAARGTPPTESVSSFSKLLNKQLLSFSHHAEQRLKQRGIQLQPEQLVKLGQALDKAAEKGSQDSLLIYKDMAFIVNVKNRTVITVIDGAAMKDNVFTQIDSTVIVKP